MQPAINLILDALPSALSHSAPTAALTMICLIGGLALAALLDMTGDR